MTKNRINIQTISTERKDFETFHFFQLEQVIEKKEKAHHSHFLKFLLVSPHFIHLVLPKTQAYPTNSQKYKNFANPLSTSIL